MGYTSFQASMSAGELSQEMYGRVDTEHYQMGLALARNFFVDCRGGLLNRPGTRYIGEVSGIVRHIPFERSPTVTYMLEFGEKVLRILSNGQYVEKDGNIFEVATPYSIDEAASIRFIQSVDVVSLFHENHPIYQVKHYGREKWLVEKFEISSGPFGDLNVTDGYLMWADAKSGETNVHSNFDIFTPEMVGDLLYLESTGSNFTNSWVQRMSATVGTYCYYAGNYYQCTSARTDALTGDVAPTHTSGERWDGPNQVLPNDNLKNYIGVRWRYSNSGFGEVRISEYISPTEVKVIVTKELPQGISTGGGSPDTDWEFIAIPYSNQIRLENPKPTTATKTSFRVYLRRTGEYVELAQSQWSIDLVNSSTAYAWIRISEQDGWKGGDGNVADLRVVQLGTDSTEAKTFKWAFSALNKTNGYPRCGTYYSQRLFLGGNEANQQTTWASKTDSYNDFGMSSPILAEDALSLTTAGLTLSTIEHLLPLNALLAFTSGGVWATSSSENSRVSAEDPPAMDIQSYNGCCDLAPIITGGEGLYVQRGWKIIREIQFDLNRGAFVDADLTIRASHIFKHRKVVSWAFAKNPFNLVWCVFDDGMAATLTYMKEQQLWAWTTHETDGLYRAVAAVEESDRTGIYFVVERKIQGQKKYYVEYQASRNFEHFSDAFFLDAGLTIDNRQDHSLTLTDGHTWNHPEDISLNTDAEFFTNDMPGETLVIREGNQVFSLLIMSVVDGKAARARIQRTIPESMRDTPLSNWGIGISEILNLSHLEGKTVTTVCDGFVGESLIVRDGCIELSRPALHVHVGLSYQSKGKTLPLHINSDSGTMKHRVKNVSTVRMELVESLGGFAGTSLDNMYPLKQREYDDYQSQVGLKSGVVEIDVSSTYDKPGQFYFMQSAPLPFCVLSLMPEFEVGG